MSVRIKTNEGLITVAGMYSGYENFTPATETENGESGLVPAPLKGDQGKYLKGDGTWATIEVGSEVEVTPTLTSGTKVADIKVGDTTNTLYAPTAPTSLSELTDDATHRLVTDTEKSTWSGKADVATTLAGYGITDAVNTADKNVANGYAGLDENGLIPTSILPGSVDEIIEAANKAAFPTTGESSKIYVALDTNLTYRWSGTEYVEISPSLALGETSSTAYAGDKGKKVTDDLAAHVADTDVHLTASDKSTLVRFEASSSQESEEDPILRRSDVDATLSSTSENPVQNKVIYENITSVANKLSTLENYSLTEKEIGTWIDNKTIYRKIVNAVVNGATTEWIGGNTIISGIDKLINIHGILVKTSGMNVPVPSSKYGEVVANGSDYTSITEPTFYSLEFKKDQGACWSTNSNEGGNLTIIMEYTKSTS